MDAQAVSERLRAGVIVLFDTNAVYSVPRMFEVADGVNRLRERGAVGVVESLIPALVHAEKLTQLRHLKLSKGELWDPTVPTKSLEMKGFRVLSFDVPHAEQHARRIADRYSTREDWGRAKLEAVTRRLAVDPPEGASNTAPTTVDWLIAAQAESEGVVLVSDDKGIEFEGVERVSLATLEKAIDHLLGEA